MITRTILATLLTLVVSCALAQLPAPEFPNRTWRKTSPESLGWSPDRLRIADEIAGKIRTDAYLVIHKGMIVHEFGNVSKATNLHSARKSVLSILIGIYVDKGVIKLDKTMADLGIDDKDVLTESEKRASVKQLLQARSGIYHRSAYEPPALSAKRPARGSFGAGERFDYNNWDFNALGTIFKMFSGVSVFDSLRDDLANPLQFEDFSPLADTRWVYEHFLSQHPAYEIRLSARDLGRIGLLMARRGRWKDEHIVSENWIRESTTSYSTAGPGIGYGYLWWVGIDHWHFGQKFPANIFSARGNYGQFLVIDPSRDLVIVHRVNSDNKTRADVSTRDFGILLAQILAAGPDLVVQR